MLLATALALLITGCAQQTFTVQNKPAAVAPKETITHHFFVSGIGQKKKLSMQPKFVAAQKMLLKQKPSKHSQMIARFYYFRHLYSAGSACVLLTIIVRVAHRYGQLYLHCSLIYSAPSSCFCIVISLLRGETIPRSAVSASRGGCIYPRRRRWWSRTD